MKNTILNNIIKHTLISEQVLDYTPEEEIDPIPIIPPVSTTTTKPKTDKTPKPVKTKKPAETKKVDLIQVKTTVKDVILNPPATPAYIYSKVDGKWKFNFVQDNALKIGDVTNASSLKKLNDKKYVAWTGKYGTNRIVNNKKDWLAQMKLYNPYHPDETSNPLIGSPLAMGVTLVLAIAGGYAISKFLAVYGLSKLASKAAQRIFQPKQYKKDQLTALIGITPEGRAQLKRLALLELGKGSISRKEYNRLLVTFDNPMFRARIKKDLFLTRVEEVEACRMTMSEFINTSLPRAYSENERITRVLLMSEQNTLTAYPIRQQAWNTAAERYARANARFRADFARQLADINLARNPGSAGPGSTLDRDAAWWRGGTASPAGTTRGNPSTSGNRPAVPAVTPAAAAAAAAEDVVNRSVSNVSYDVKDAINWSKELGFGSFDPTETLKKLTNFNLAQKMSWGLYIGSGNFANVMKFLTTLGKLKNPGQQDVIKRLKKFAADNRWDKRNQEIIDDFVRHVLRNFHPRNRS